MDNDNRNLKEIIEEVLLKFSDINLTSQISRETISNEICTEYYSEIYPSHYIFNNEEDELLYTKYRNDK